METKHTPGPWILHPTAHHPAVRSIGTPDTGPRRICTVGTMNGNPVDKANARLIAAAPELLEAAIELKDVCNRPSAARTRAEAWRKLDKAIAKALQPNVKVEQLAEGGSARTPCSIVASSTISGYRESAPSPMLPHGEPCTKRGHADYVGCSCLRQRAFRRKPWGDATASRSWSRAQRLADDILK